MGEFPGNSTNKIFVQFSSFQKVNMKSIKLFFLLFLLHFCATAQILGCPDPLANNYNANATQNDGSCLYNAATIAPTASFDLDSTVKETSGLLLWQNKLWTQNDDSDNKLYALDTLDGSILSAATLNGLTNIDWEEISQDDSFIYMGDFGNNVSGNRTNLRIYKMDKQSILLNNPHIDTIAFSYADQSDFTAQTANLTDFDCEAFVVTDDSIFLFTKQWVTHKSSVYALPKTSGNHQAQLRATFNVDGLITGAVLLNSKRVLALSGYSPQLQPFVYLLYDFQGTNFFTGNKRKLQLDLPFHQVEGITTANGLKLYVSNEAFSYGPIVVPPQLHILDLNDYLATFLNAGSTGIETKKKSNTSSIFPNPAKDKVTISKAENETIIVRDISGKMLQVPMETTGENCILDISKLAPGVYFVGFGVLIKE